MKLTTNRVGVFSEGCRIVSSFVIPWTKTLDLGCGTASHTSTIKECVFMDAEATDHTPKGMIVGDIRTQFPDDSFGTCFMLDVIEHMTKDDGLKLLGKLKNNCQRIVLFTPLGDLWITDNPSPHSHKSGWTPDDLPGWNFWVWPSFHKFADGNTHGAFWAWKTFRGEEVTPLELATISGITP